MKTKIDKQAEIFLRKAEEDETVIHIEGVPDGPFGFHAQQSAEKLLKALLCQLQVEFRRTHELAYLVRLLKDQGELIPDQAVRFSDLESFAVVHRYDDIPDFEILDRPEAINAIRVLREFVTERIAALSATP